MSIDPEDRTELKRALAELSPSPWLEDAALEIARETPIEPRRSRTWIAVAAAAALVLGVGVWSAFQSDAFEWGGDVSSLLDTPPLEPAREGKAGVPDVLTPPSPLQVEAARRQSPLPHFGDRDVGPDHWITIGSVAPGSTVGTDGPLDGPPSYDSGLLHRFAVNGEERGPHESIPLDAGMAAEPGVMLAGLGLLKHLGDWRISAGRGIEAVFGAERRTWMPVTGTRDFELIVGSPDRGGAEARVRIRLSTAYEGTLLLEEPIARALGLHQFEISGGARITGGMERDVSSARARIRIPELGVDVLKRVEVLPWRHWNVVEAKRDPDHPAAGWIRFEGSAVPSRVIHADGVRLEPEGSVTISSDEHDTQPMSIGVRATDGIAEVGVVDDGPKVVCADYGEGTYLFLGRVDLVRAERWTFAWELRWIELSQRVEPGARVLVSRVWRGARPVPSKSGVAVTRADESGTVRFPWAQGEAGDAVRMLVVPEGDDATLHSLRLSDAMAIRATIRGSTVVLGSESYDAAKPLLEALKALVAERRRAHPESRRIEIVAGDGARLEAVERLLIACSHPGVRLDQIAWRALSDGGAVDAELPTDRGLHAKPLDTLRVVLRPGADGAPVVEVPQRGGEAAVIPLDRLAAVTSAIGGAVTGPLDDVAGVIAIRRASDGREPSYLAFVRLIRAMREAGLTTITMESRPPK